jgi:replicative DNA helicase
VCRGARAGCVFLKSASTSAGKSRTSIFDACHLAYPKRWSHKQNDLIEELQANGEPREPRKVLFIVTEMDKEELQTIMLAYLSGVDEDHILTGKYDLGELTRVHQAAKIIEEYSGYFIIEEISDPNLQNVEATIRKYATVDNVKYVFFDYIHTTASMIAQFSRNNLREDVVLMLMANQLKQLAKDYNLFIFSATQVNALAMGDDEMGFKDEKSIRGSKAVADKADMGYVMTRVSEKGWLTIVPTLKQAAREGTISPDIIDNPPTHVLDIYKMRRGRYKMIRIWCRIHLGTGERTDLFITNAVNQPIAEPLDLFSSASERKITI